MSVPIARAGLARAVFGREFNVDFWAVTWFSLLGLALTFAVQHAVPIDPAILLAAL